MPENKVVVCFPFCGNDVGGSHISSLGLIKNIDRLRFKPIVLVDVPDGKIEQLMRQADVEIRHVPDVPSLEHGKHLGWRNVVTMTHATGSLTSLLRNLHAEIVHTNDGRTHATWALAAKLAGAKLVWHHRGSPGARGLRFVAPFLADAIVSVSDFALGNRRVPQARVIHSPFDDQHDTCRPTARRKLLAELACDTETKLLGFFGVLINRKRPLDFVEAIGAIRRAEPHRKVRGVIFGAPLELDEDTVLAHAKRHGVADIIHLMGFRLPGATWIAACDLLLVPAIDEPFGRTLIEAMLVGTPVVATASGGNVEALQHGRLGVLVPPNNPRAMATEALQLLSDTQRHEQLSGTAQRHAAGHFGAQQHASSVMAVYDELMAAAAKPKRSAIPAL